MKKLIYSKLTIVMFLFVSIAYGQDYTITGKVTASGGEPLPGASVIVQGTSTGTMTDFDGNYALEVNSNSHLVFTYVGFITRVVPTGNFRELFITLEEDTEALDEVVVLGYGTQKKSDLTGAITSIKSEELLKQSTYTALKAIQGRLSGVNIITSDAPGSNPTVIIRGVGTASAGSGVLYIVDGIQTNGISNINPADIETMDVLKDVASSAIYGMDAANGVIIVTTKKGKQGKPKVQFSSIYGTASILNEVKMANGAQYIDYFNENQAALDQYQLSENQRYDTNWYDELIDIGFSTNNNISFSGATETKDYFF